MNVTAKEAAKIIAARKKKGKRIPEFVEETRRYAKQCQPGSMMDWTLVRTRIPQLLAIIEAQRNALSAICDFNLPSEGLKRIARRALDMEVPS